MAIVEKRRGSGEAGRIHYTFIHWTQTWQRSAMWNFCNQMEDKTNRKHDAVTKSFHYLWILGTAMRFIWQKDCLKTANCGMGCFSSKNIIITSTFSSSVFTNLHFHIGVTHTHILTHTLQQNNRHFNWYIS